MDFEEFCAAATSVYQLEALDRWEQHARCAYELFEKDGNRAIMIEELASVSCFFLLGRETISHKFLIFWCSCYFKENTCSLIAEIEFLNLPIFF